MLTQGLLVRMMRPACQVSVRHETRHSKVSFSANRKLMYEESHPARLNRDILLARHAGKPSIPMLGGVNRLSRVAAWTIQRLFDAVDVPIELLSAQLPFESQELQKQKLDQRLESMQRSRLGMDVDPEDRWNFNRELGLYASIVKLQSVIGFGCRFPEVDMVLIAQNGAFDMDFFECQTQPNVVETMRMASSTLNRRFLELVFEYSIQHSRRKITFGHKMHKFPLFDGLFIETAIAMNSSSYPEIDIEWMPVDRMVRHMVLNPDYFDVICTNSNYGSIVISIASAVCGGAGLFSCIDMGDEYALFKPLQMKLSLSDRRELSPYGLVRACVDLLTCSGNADSAHSLWLQLHHTMTKDKLKTEEYGGDCNAEYVIRHIIGRLRRDFRCRVEEH